MVKTLNEILKEKDVEKENGEIATIQLFLTRQEANMLLRIAEKKIKGSAYIVANPKKYDEDVIENAKKYAGIWENIGNKIDSQI